MRAALLRTVFGLLALTACEPDLASPDDAAPVPDAGSDVGPRIDRDAAQLTVRAGSTLDAPQNRLTLTARDDQAAPLAWSIVAGPAHGGATIAPDRAPAGDPVEVAYAPGNGFVGVDAFTVEVRDPGGQVDQLVVDVNVEPALAVAIAALPVGTVGQPYLGTLAATGARAALTWSLVDGTLPSGVSLGSDGTLTGTPASAGSSPIRVRVVEAGGPAAEAGVVVHVNAAGLVPPTLIATALPIAQVAQPYAWSVRAAGGTGAYQFAVEAGAPAPGLDVFPHPALARVVIAGRPTSAATEGRLVVRVTDAAGAIATALLDVPAVAADAPPPLAVETRAVPVAVAGAPFSTALATIGGAAPIGLAIVDGVLPSGLSLDGALLSGTPSVAGAYPIRVRATDAAGAAADADLTVYVNPPGIAPVPMIEGRLADDVHEGQETGTAFELGDGDLELKLAGGELPPALRPYPYGLWWGMGMLVGTPAAGTAAASPWRFAVAGHDAATGAWGTAERTLDVIPDGAVWLAPSGPVALHVDVDSPLAGPFNDVTLIAHDLDAGDASLTWTIATAPAHGEAAIRRGAPSSPGAEVVVAYAPEAGYAGTDAFVVEVSDGDGHTDTVTVEVEVSGTENTFHWAPVNGGVSLDPPPGAGSAYGEASTLRLADGTLLISGRGAHLGRYLARVSPTGVWQYWTPSGWQGGTDVVPASIEHAHNAWGRLSLAEDPSTPGALVGVAQQGYRVGDQIMDSHGVPSEVRFDGTRWQSWSGGTAFDPYQSSPLLYSWNGTGDRRAGVAFDLVHGEALVVGGIGFSISSFASQMAATRLDLAHPTSRWRRWHREPGTTGGWADHNHWPNNNDHAESRKAFVLDAGAALAAHRLETTRVVHLTGTRQYLAFGAIANTSTQDSRVIAARYRADTAAWDYWNGSTWADASTTGYLATMPSVAPTSGGAGWSLEAIDTPDGPVAAFVDTEQLKVVSYDATTPGFVAQTLGPADYASPVVLGVAPDGTPWLLTVRDGIRVERRRRVAGVWTGPELIFASDLHVTVEGLGWAGDRAVVLARQRDPVDPSATGTLFALGDRPATTWAGEQPVSAPTWQVAPPLTGATWIGRVANSAPGASYGATPPMGLAVDEDGYTYAARYPVCGLIVSPPGATDASENESWGKFWDYFDFPGAIALDRTRGRLYATNGLLLGGAGGIAAIGDVRVWDYRARRDDSFGWQAYGEPLPADWIRHHAPQVIAGGQVWPAGVAVDEPRGLLYVADGLRSRVRVYDIANLVDSDAPMGRAWLGKSRVPSGDHATVDALVDELIAQGHLVDAGAQVRWAATTWEAVDDAIVASASFALLGAQDASRRSFMEEWQQRHDLPVWRFDLGGFGAGAGQFQMVGGLAVGPDGDLYAVDVNGHRVQRLRVDAATGASTVIATLGTRGRGAGQLLYPLGVSVSPAGEVFVADPSNARITVFNAAGAYLRTFGSVVDPDGVAWPLDRTLGIAADRPGRLVLGAGADLVTLATE